MVTSSSGAAGGLVAHPEGLLLPVRPAACLPGASQGVSQTRLFSQPGPICAFASSKQKAC